MAVVGIEQDIGTLLELTEAELTATAVELWNRKLSRLGMTNTRSGALLALGGQALTLRQLKTIQAEVKALVTHLLALREVKAGESGETPSIVIRGPLAVNVLPFGRRGHALLMVEGNPLDRLRYRLLRLLESADLKRIRRCPSAPCERRFVKIGKRTFCSSRCRIRQYMRTYEPGTNDAAPEPNTSKIRQFKRETGRPS